MTLHTEESAVEAAVPVVGPLVRVLRLREGWADQKGRSGAPARAAAAVEEDWEVVEAAEAAELEREPADLEAAEGAHCSSSVGPSTTRGYSPPMAEREVTEPEPTQEAVAEAVGEWFSSDTRR